jgi:hypothetical protein
MNQTILLQYKSHFRDLVGGVFVMSTATPPTSPSSSTVPPDATMAKQVTELSAKLKALALKYTQDKKQWEQDTNAMLEEKKRELTLVCVCGYCCRLPKTRSCMHSFFIVVRLRLYHLKQQ